MPSTERDLIAEGRERLTALSDSLSTDRAMDLALWAGQNLALLLAELEAQRERVNELAAQRNPDDEVLVEGSWFHPDDLPKILGNHMRSIAEESRRVKDMYIELEKARAQVVELEDWQGSTLARISRLMTVDRTIRFRRDIPQDADLAKALDAVLDERDRLREAAQRPPLGYVVGWEGPDGPELYSGRREIHHDEDVARLTLADMRKEEPCMDFQLYGVQAMKS